MNKKIIGISIAMLFATGGALAQSSVTMYGTVDAGVAYINGSDFNGKLLNLESGQQSYSRLGFKGTEDLGSGMKALFVLEQGIRIGDGSSGIATLGNNIPFVDNSGTFSTNTFSSQAYVGLGGNFGTVKLGRTFTPLYEAYEVIDPFKNGFAASMNNMFGNDEANSSSYQRMGNSIVYSTPDNLSGFKGSVAYGFGEIAGSTSSQSQVGVSLGYMNGPLTLVYAYHQANNDLGDPVLRLNGTFKTHFIGAAYDFGMAKIHLAADQNKRDSSFKTRDYMIGLTVPFGASSIFADYTHKDYRTAPFGSNNGLDANQYAIGYTYNLSKRTNFYSAYTYVRNKANSSVDTFVAGNNVNVFQIGVRHLF